MGPTRQERTEKIARERTEQIIGAALEIFARKGFAAATTAEIARTAGVSEGTVFKYFKSKRELFIAVIKSFIITGPLLDLIDRLPEGNIDETFRLIMQDRFRLMDDSRISHIPMLITDVIRDPELRILWIEEFLHPFLDRMADVYRKLMESGIYRDMEPDVAVRTVGGMIFGFLFFRVMEGESSSLNDIPPESVTGGLIDILLHGVLREGLDNEKRERRAEQ